MPGKFLKKCFITLHRIKRTLTYNCTEHEDREQHLEVRKPCPVGPPQKEVTDGNQALLNLLTETII